MKHSPLALSRCFCRTHGLAALLVTVSFTLAGCPVGPNNKPKLSTPAPHAFRNDPKPAAKVSIANEPWWEVFNDADLGALIRQAQQSNLDLRIAMGRIEAARATKQAAFWALFPSIGAMAGGGVGRGFPGVPGVFPPFELAGHWGANVSASWEIDLWGKLRRRSESASALSDASLEDQRAVWVALFGDIADNYFQLIALDLAADYAKKAVGTRNETHELFLTRLKGKVGNELETSRAEANVREAEARYADIQRLIGITENTIALLIGKPPMHIQRRSLANTAWEPPNAPAGLPSELLDRRPDVLAAKQRLLSANAQIGASMADYFPRFDLMGTYGFISQDLSQLTQSDSTKSVYLLNGAFTWRAPFLGGYNVQAANRTARAEFDIAKALYEKTALTAFKEVGDALVAVQRLKEGRTARDGQVKALEHSVEIANMRFVGGVSNYLEVINSQERVFLAQLELAQLKGDQFSAIVRLYRALGGGWDR